MYSLLQQERNWEEQPKKRLDKTPESSSGDPYKYGARPNDLNMGTYFKVTSIGQQALHPEAKVLAGQNGY